MYLSPFSPLPWRPLSAPSRTKFASVRFRGFDNGLGAARARNASFSGAMSL
jgi:hypothetical protein